MNFASILWFFLCGVIVASVSPVIIILNFRNCQYSWCTSHLCYWILESIIWHNIQPFPVLLDMILNFYMLEKSSLKCFEGSYFMSINSFSILNYLIVSFYLFACPIAKLIWEKSTINYPFLWMFLIQNIHQFHCLFPYYLIITVYS